MSDVVPKTRRRGRPRTIDRETVLAAAMAQTESDLNVLLLAESLGTTATAIYRLFGDKPGLFAAMYAAAIGKLGPISGAQWTEWLDDYAARTLELARRYPFVVVQRFDQGNVNAELIHVAERTLAMIEPGIAMLARAGLDRDSARAALNAVSALVVDHVRNERVRAEATVDLSSVALSKVTAEQTLWKILRIFRKGLQAEMRATKADRSLKPVRRG